MKKQITLILSFIFLFSSLALAQPLGPQTLSMLEESPAGSQILQFLEAINANGPVDEALVKKCFAQQLIDKHQPAKLKGMLQDIRENDAPIALYSASRQSKFVYSLKLQSGGGNWLDLILNLEEAPPFKVAGISIDVTNNPAEQEQQIWPAGTSKMAPPTLASREEIARQAKAIAQAYHDMGWFSGVVLIAEQGQPFYQEAFGYADIDNQIPNTTDTKFRIGSINKDYTSVLVLQMVEAGQLSLDDKLEKFQLGFPAEVAGKITIRQLLSHTSGFGDIFTPQYLSHIRDYKNIGDILPLLMNEPLAYEPGTSQEYSNYGYIVLGAILEKVSGKSYENLLREKIFKPLGAKNTHYQIAEKIEGEARSYRFTPSGEKIDHTSQLEYPTPDGGMYSTAAEQLDFFQALFYTNKLISDESKALLFGDYAPNLPSWKEIKSQEGSIQAFAGGGPGVSAVVMFLLKENLMAVVLANTDGNIAGNISRRLEQAAFGRPVRKVQLPVENYLYGVLKKEGSLYLKQNIDILLEQGGYEARSPMMLNQLGYGLLEEEMFQDAIEVFRINTELYPEEANPWDSLAEAYLKSGDKKTALKFYRKALEIDPELPSAKEMVGALE
ncbi:MAG: serine hydrolase [Lewinellaceae bacterium]|nr:serine hydrolase [Lewinellaceae bacterium]